MDKGKQQGCSPFSFTEDLFGPKNSSKSPSSSAGHFGSIFGPPNSVPRGVVKKDKNNTEPYYNSSIYYGGQEVYSPSTHTTSPHYVANSQHSGTVQLKKNSATVDRNENNSSSASRGNWWQGSLYY